MIFPRFSTMRFPGLKGQTFMQRFARGIMLGCILALAAWAFWINVGHRLQGIKEDAVVRDELGIIHDADRKQFATLSAAFENQYGITLSIKILRGAPPEFQDMASLKRITVFLYPQHNFARLELPPLVRTAVGEELRQKLEVEYLGLGMERGLTLEALVKALRIIWDCIGGTNQVSPSGMPE